MISLLAPLLVACLAADPLVLTNGQVTVAVRPDLGGKIVSLQDAAGNERLSRTEKPYVTRHPGMLYGDGEFDGADEIFPHLAPEEAAGRNGHGDLWTQVWEVIPGDGIALAVTGQQQPFRFTRTITLDGDQVVCAYTVTHHGDAPLPYAYYFHPLFALVDGVEIDLPADQPCRVLYSRGVEIGSAGTLMPWSSVQERLGPLRADSGRFWKVVAENVSAPVRLRWPDGGAVTLSWDTDHLPHAAFWCSESGVGELRHLACEPTNNPHDALTPAIADGSAHILAPGETHAWTIRLHLEPPP